jgi:hypothetical protein
MGDFRPRSFRGWIKVNPQKLKISRKFVNKKERDKPWKVNLNGAQGDKERKSRRTLEIARDIFFNNQFYQFVSI